MPRFLPIISVMIAILSVAAAAGLVVTGQTVHWFDDLNICFVPSGFLPIGILALALLVANILLTLTARKTTWWDSRLTALCFRLGWLNAVTLPALATFLFFPRFSANIFFFLIPAFVGWALLAFYDFKPAKPGQARNEVVPGFCVIIFFTVLFWVIGVYFTNSVGAHSGDEGHYLLQASSLYFDGDLDLRNNFENPDNTDRTHVHISPNSRGGKWYSWHPPGLSFLLMPTIAGGVIWRHLVLGLIAGLGLAGMYWLSRMFGADAKSSLICVFLLGGGAFWGIYSSRALPEVLGAALTVCGLLGALAQRRYPWLTILPVVFCIGFLPWVQTRFVPVALTLLGCYGLHGLLGHERAARKVFRLGVFTCAAVTALVFYRYAQLRMFHGGLSYPVPQLLFSDPAGLWHTLASSRGIVFMFPLFACALASTLYMACRKDSRWHGVYALLLFMSVWLTSCATIWFTGGACLPGRFLLVITPVLMASLACVMTASNRAFRALSLYLGLVPVLFFAVQLTMLSSFGKSFPDPYMIERLHPFFPGLARFFYDPSETFSPGPTLALYLSALILVYSPGMKRAIQYLYLIGLLIIFAAYAQVAEKPLSVTGKRATALALERIDFNDYYPARLGAVAEPRWLFDWSNRFAGLPDRETRSVTTRDLGQLLVDNWISVPYLDVNDWDARGFKWATLATPFRSWKGARACFIHAAVEGACEVELVIREGSRNHVEKTFKSGDVIQETFVFETDDRGDMYLLVRFVSGDGTFTIREIAYSPSPSGSETL